MKPTKKLNLLIALVFIFSALAACGYNNNATPDNNAQNYDPTGETQRYDTNNNGMRGMNNNDMNNGMNNGMNRGNMTGPNAADRMGRDTGMGNGFLNPTGNNRQNMDQSNVANRMQRAAERVNGVNDANVVVHRNNAIVGIDTNGEGDTNMIENRVQQAVRNVSTNHRVHVTSDEDLNNRIQQLDTGMQNGNPARDMTQDAGQIIRDIGNNVTAPFR